MGLHRKTSNYTTFTFTCALNHNHTRPCCAAEVEFVAYGILYRYQLTEPFDGRNCQIILPPIQHEKKEYKKREEQNRQYMVKENLLITSIFFKS